MKRLLVPLDGSELAELALPPATELASSLDGDLLLVRIIQPPVPTEAYTPGLVDEIEKAETREATGYLDRVAERLRQDGVRVETRVLVAKVAPAINRVAAEADCDLIVLTSHGYGGTGFDIFGSVAQKLLHSASVPILIVRAAAQAIDREEEAEEAAADRAMLRRLQSEGGRT